MHNCNEKILKQIDSLITEVALLKEILLNRIEKPEEVPKCMSADEIISYLHRKGYSISKSKLYKLTHESEIPHSKIGNKLIFSVSEIDKWFENQINNNVDSFHRSNSLVFESAQYKYFKNKNQ